MLFRSVDVESNPNTIKRVKEFVNEPVADQSSGEIKVDGILAFPNLRSGCHRPPGTPIKVGIPYFQARDHGLRSRC